MEKKRIVATRSVLNVSMMLTAMETGTVDPATRVLLLDDEAWLAVGATAALTVLEIVTAWVSTVGPGIDLEDEQCNECT